MFVLISNLVFRFRIHQTRGGQGGTHFFLRSRQTSSNSPSRISAAKIDGPTLCATATPRQQLSRTTFEIFQFDQNILSDILSDVVIVEQSMRDLQRNLARVV
jgi:hypothetical protein